MNSKRARAMSRLVTGLVSAVLAIGLLAACGGDDDADTASAPAATTETTAPATTESTETTETETETETSTQEASAEGKQVFTANCSSCHTLADADASGSVGPNLDDLKSSKGAVEAKVKAGGGGMPAFEDTLSAAEITAVAEYVADVASG